MSDQNPVLTTEEKRELLRKRLASGRKLPKTYPASYSQRRLWFMHKLAPDSPAYNVEAALPLGAINVDVLERAINGVVERHGALRTTFIEVDGEPVQRVAPEFFVPLEQIDLSRLSLKIRDAKLAEIRKNCATEPFDLAAGPLVRTRLLRLSNGNNMLLLNLHHILADGWSMGIFSQELSVLYEAFSAGQPSPLAALPLQYGDFSAWQRGREGGEELSKELAWWTDKLAGMKPLDLPTDFARPPVKSFTGAFHNHTYSPDLTARIEAFARENDATLFMTLLSGFKALLGRLAQAEDVAVGTYIANRERTEIEGLIGFFLNTMVLRTKIPHDATFLQALAAVKETALGAYANQMLPFELLVETLKPPRDLGRNPLVQIVFQLQNATEDKAGGSSALIDYQRSAAAFDLAVTAYQQNGQLHFTYEYATDLFEGSTIARFATRLERLLDQAISTPSTKVSAFNILLPDEAPKRASAFVHRGEDPMAISIPQLFAEAVAKNPDAPAFYVGAACATVGQVAACADRIATALQDTGVVKGDVVCVCLPRSVELSATLVAIWQVGAIYLPLDPAYPLQRLGFMVEDSGARCVVLRHDTGAGLPEELPRINVNTAIGDLSKPTLPFQPVQLSPDDPSHIIYTSGSTGKPKGALSPHRQVLNRFHWMWRQFPHGPHEVEAVKTATSFIDSIWELLGPMTALTPATIVEAQTLLEPSTFTDQLAADGVTRLWVTPSYLRLLIESLPDLGARLPDLTTWFITGEKLPAELVRRFRASMPNAKLINLYGTSEAWDVCCDCDGCLDEPSDPVPIGRPLDTVSVAILDAKGDPVPFGIPGELYVSGAALCLGFVGHDKLRYTRIINVDTEDGTIQMLASGDRGRRRSDGRFDILGRMDDELKINGMRVHPAEVEACLGALDCIGSAAVSGVTGPDGTMRLFAWFTVSQKPVPKTSTIRTKLAKKLPAHMIPERIIMVNSMPKTPSGKVDRNALARDKALHVEPKSDLSTAQTSETERAIASVFSDLFGRDIAANENFFAAGGHSLLAVRAISRINDKLSVTLDIRDFFMDPTAVGLAKCAEMATARSGPVAIERLARNAAKSQITAGSK